MIGVGRVFVVALCVVVVVAPVPRGRPSGCVV